MKQSRDKALEALFSCCNMGLSWAEAREWQVRRMVLLTGLVMGGMLALLSYLGNPANSGICVSCFLENIVGALGFHGNPRMQYLRPEIIGFVLGAFLMARMSSDFRVTGGSSPAVRFVAGAFLIIGSAVFMGCPIKMIQRLGSGDLTALAGVAGLVAGVWAGIGFYRNGFSLEKPQPMKPVNGYLVPLLMLGMLGMLLFEPSFLRASQTGSGASHTALWISLAAGLLIGSLAQRSHFCVTGSIGTVIVGRDLTLVSGLLTMLGTVFLASLMTGQFHPGVMDQPTSNLSWGWNGLGMFLVGLGSMLVGGCPFRQLVLSGSGNVDAGVTTLGMFAGAALVQNWGLGGTNLGTPSEGKIAVLAGIVFMAVLGLAARKRDKKV